MPRKPGTSGTHVPARKTATDATATTPASASVDSAPHRIGRSTVRKATAQREDGGQRRDRPRRRLHQRRVRQELIHHGRVNLRAGDLAGRAERRDEDVVQAGGGDADEDDGVLEDGRVDSRLAPVLKCRPPTAIRSPNE